MRQEEEQIDETRGRTDMMRQEEEQIDETRGRTDR